MQGKKYKTPLRHQNKRIKKRGWSYGEYNCRVGGKDKFTFKHIRRGKFFKRLGDVFHLSMTKLWERESGGHGTFKYEII